MSIEVTNAVWKHSKSKGRDRLVLLAIADHQGEIGSWPSIKTLAGLVNASERSIQRSIKDLEESGELIVKVQSAPIRQQYKSNLYWVNLPGVTKQNSGVTNSDSGVTKSSSGVTTDGALTLIEPLKEPLRQATLLPEDFRPSQKSIDEMVEHFPWVDLKKQTHAFRDYWNSQPTSKAKKTDWDATWRNWIRRSADYGKPKDEPTQTKHRFSMEEE
jgi:hypothetical protein